MIRILLYILIISLPIFGDELPDETVDIEVIGNTVAITDNNVYVNCCSNFESDVHISGNTITITQRDTSSQKCRCMCAIDLKHDINQLKAGNYELIIYREELVKYGYDKNQKIFIYKGEFKVKSTSAESALSVYFEQMPCKTNTSLSDETDMLDKVEVFPNPASAAVTIRFPVQNTQKVNLKLFNFLGKEIKQENYGILQKGIHTATIDAGNIPSGLYFGKLIYANGESLTFRIIWSK